MGGDPGTATVAEAASPSTNASSAAESSSFQIRGNASGPAVFHAAFEVPEPTECSLQHRYHMQKEDVLFNGTGVSQVRIENGMFTGWNHHRATTLVQAHAGEHRYRSDVRSAFFDTEGDVYVLAMDRPYQIRVEDRLRVSVAAEHWAVPDAPNSSLELTIDCHVPASPPDQVETMERARLTARDTSTGGVGVSVDTLAEPGVNLLDQGSFETSERRVEVHGGLLCLGGTGYGRMSLDTPQGEDAWEMDGVMTLGEDYRYVGAPGAYTYTVTWAGVGCHWWLGLWPAPSVVGPS